MQRWFFLDQKKIRKPKKPKSKKESQQEVSVSVEDIFEPAAMGSRPWKFIVSAPEVGPGEKVVITGNIEALGEWDINKVVELERDSANAETVSSDIWSKTIVVPEYVAIHYRYVICTFNSNGDIIIKSWETNLHPRLIKETATHPITDLYGDYDGQQNIGKGWLNGQTVIQFKFMHNPLNLKARLADRLMNIKVTPVKLSFSTENEIQVEESSMSLDNMETEQPVGVAMEVSTLDNDYSICQFHPQEQFGREYRPNDVLLINVYAPKPKEFAYLVDLYSYSTRAKSPDAPPCHMGYTYVLPNMLKQSEGTMELPVTCNVKHRPLGTINIQYLIIKPMEQKMCDFSVSYAKHWDPSWTGLEVGHRGLGASFKKKEGNAIRENTIASLKKAAASGADLLEFDVQLSKDLIPVIYHDFHVCISMKRKREMEFAEMLELPVKDLTLEHLQKLKVYHLVEGRSHEVLFNDEELEEHQPFPTLQEVLETIDPHVGFNVELKWTMEMNDGTFELNNPFDINTYVDKVLEIVLKFAGTRRIVLSCFNPDICVLVRLKQNKYPVMFLTVGITKKYQPYRDPRCLSIPAAIQHAISSDILGIVVHTEDLLRDPSQVKLVTNVGLVIFCWGDDNNDKNTIKKLKEMGLHAVIYDKLDQYSTKEVKESIFLMEARESQREMMQLAALDTAASGSGSGSASSAGSAAEDNRPFLDLELLRKQGHSTVTSLESLASSVDLKEESDRNLKRNRNVISSVHKESQLKSNYRGAFPCGGDVSKKTPKPSPKRKCFPEPDSPPADDNQLH